MRKQTEVEGGESYSANAQDAILMMQWATHPSLQFGKKANT